MHAFVKFPAEYVARVEAKDMFHSPTFYLLYYVFLAEILWIVYATRYRTTWYLWRVAVFAMISPGV